jgi:2,4'-dihydroxyacetophenone dioxygenase
VSSIVPDDIDEMITDFQVNGVMYYVSPHDKHLRYEEVLTKTGMCRAHFEEVGLGADFLKRFLH